MAEWHFYASGPDKTNEKKLWTTGTDAEKKLITVETFKDGQEACQAFSAKEPDMLILDIMMEVTR